MRIQKMQKVMKQKNELVFLDYLVMFHFVTPQNLKKTNAGNLNLFQIIPHFNIEINVFLLGFRNRFVGNGASFF